MTQVGIKDGLPLIRSGKVRDLYDIDDERMLIYASDTVSALDEVLPTPIPMKGEVLTEISVWGFQKTQDFVPNHFIAHLNAQNAKVLPVQFPPEFYGRSMIVQKAKRIDVECVVRGYLSGSGYRSYQESGHICGVPLPQGLVESSRLPEPIFTPTTKADEGHDEPITFEDMEDLIGPRNALTLKNHSISLYLYFSWVAQQRGVLIADTKFEFGLWNNDVILIDEVVTPDSSRFWPVETYRPGGSQESLDKQLIRDWLAASWDGKGPIPELPQDIVAATTNRYLEVCKMLTGKDLLI